MLFREIENEIKRDFFYNIIIYIYIKMSVLCVVFYVFSAEHLGMSGVTLYTESKKDYVFTTVGRASIFKT